MPRRNITSKNVGAWLGGNRGYVQSGSNTDTSAKVDSGGGQMEAVRGELGLGAYAAGIGTTAAIGAGVAAVKSGRAAQAVNKVTGKTVLVHGTGNKLEGTALRPVGGSPGAPNEKVVFGWNPLNKGAKDTIPINVQEYAAKTWNMADVPEYNVVIGKAPSRAVTKVEGNPAILKSTEPAKIKAVVKANVDYETYVNNLNKALKKAGAPLKGDSRFGPMGDRVERIRRQMQYRRNNRNSTA